MRGRALTIRTRTNSRCSAFVLFQHRVDVGYKCGNEADIFCGAPPCSATLGGEEASQEGTGGQLERPCGKNSALGSIPDMKRGPGMFLQQLLQSQLIGSVHGTYPGKTGGHELSEIAVFSDCHADHGPLSHGGIVLVALERSGILFDL